MQHYIANLEYQLKEMNENFRKVGKSNVKMSIQNQKLEKIIYGSN